MYVAYNSRIFAQKLIEALFTNIERLHARSIAEKASSGNERRFPINPLCTSVSQLIVN